MLAPSSRRYVLNAHQLLTRIISLYRPIGRPHADGPESEALSCCTKLKTTGVPNESLLAAATVPINSKLEIDELGRRIAYSDEQNENEDRV